MVPLPGDVKQNFSFELDVLGGCLCIIQNEYVDGPPKNEYADYKLIMEPPKKSLPEVRLCHLNSVMPKMK